MGNKFRNFPQVMEDALKLSGVKLFEPKPVSEKLLLKVHTKELVDQTKRAGMVPGSYVKNQGVVDFSLPDPFSCLYASSYRQ